MRALGMIAGSAALGLVLGAVTAPPARASLGFELNGPYRVISNGDWARTNEVFMDEATVSSIWTFTSTCSDAHTCTGTVSSDQGWSAPLEFRTTRWIVDRFHEKWQPCPDGSVWPGRQRFQFHGANANGQNEKRITDTLMGYDRTIGISGACGVNQALVIMMPLRLQKL